MKHQYTAVIKHDEGWWIGWVEEVPGVNCRANTRAGLRRSLRAALLEALPRPENQRCKPEIKRVMFHHEPNHD